MKYLSLAFLALLALGCKAQVPPNPTVLTCPAVGSYTPLNQSSPATGTSYTDSKPAAGSYCYVAQSVLGSNTSAASNVTGPFTTSGSNSVGLTWNPPSSGPTPSGYVLSRAPAISTTLLAPALGNGTVAQVKPALPNAIEAPKLMASLR